MTALAVVLGVVVLGLAATLVALVWRTTQADPRREAEHRFLLSILQVAHARSVAEAAQADAIRDSAKRDEDMEAAVQAMLSTEVQEQHRRGYAGEAAEARAWMVKAGLDPDDDAAVDAWNRRLGTSLT